MKKKIVSLCLVVALAATAVIGGTLAYFTDTEEAENVFTVGKVDVELIESYVHRGAATAYENTADAQGNHAYPDVASGEHTDEQVLSGAGEAYTKYLAAQTLMPGIHINKMPYVKNTGNTDAYVRIRVMIPAGLDKYMDEAVFCASAVNGDTKEFTMKPTYNTTVSGETGVVTDYAVYTFVRDTALEPGKMTYWNVWNTITLDKNITNQDIEAAIEDKLINADDLTLGIKVQVDAIQADSFADAAAAFEAFDGQIANSVSVETYSANAIEGYVTDEVGK